MKFQDDIPSFPSDIFKDHLALMFDLISMQDVTGNFNYPELVGKPLREELRITFVLEHVTELIFLG